MKTWGADPLVQEIREKLRILKKEAVYPWRIDYGYGYKAGIDDALKAIRKVMKCRASIKKKAILKEFEKGNKRYLKNSKGGGRLEQEMKDAVTLKQLGIR